MFEYMRNKNKYFILIYSYGTGVVWKVMGVWEVVIGGRKLGYYETFSAKVLSYGITIHHGRQNKFGSIKYDVQSNALVF